MLDGAGSGGHRQSPRPCPQRGLRSDPPPRRHRGQRGGEAGLCPHGARATGDPPVLPANKERGHPLSPGHDGARWAVPTPAPPLLPVLVPSPRPAVPLYRKEKVPVLLPGTACPNASRAAAGRSGSTATTARAPEWSCLDRPARSGLFPEMEPSPSDTSPAE